MAAPANRRLSSDVGSILEQMDGVLTTFEERLASAASPGLPPLIARTHLRFALDQHARFVERDLRDANERLRPALDGAIGALDGALSSLAWLSAVPLLCSRASFEEAQGVAAFADRTLRSEWFTRVEPRMLEEPEPTIEALRRADLILVFATEALLQQTASDESWLKLLDERARRDDVFVLTIGLGVRERWERLSRQARATQRFIHLDEDLLRKAAAGSDLDAYYADALGAPLREFAQMLFDDGAVQQWFAATSAAYDA